MPLTKLGVFFDIAQSGWRWLHRRLFSPITRCGKYLDVAPDLICGQGCRVWSFAVICPGVRMGQRCVIGSKTYIGRGATIGNDLHLQDGSHLTDGIVIGHRVFIGAGVQTMNDKDPSVVRSKLRELKPETYTAMIIRPPIIEDDVVIGSHAAILPGVRLGEGCIIGAAAVVTKDVPAGETWVGIPARRLEREPRQVSSIIDDLGISEALYTQVCCGPETRDAPE